MSDVELPAEVREAIRDFGYAMAGPVKLRPGTGAHKALCTALRSWARTLVAAERARGEAAREALRWVCGYAVPGWPEFTPPPDAQTPAMKKCGVFPRYWWRRVLMDRIPTLATPRDEPGKEPR